VSSARIAWIASYPRSGSTWLRLALSALDSVRPVDINRPELKVRVAGTLEFDEFFGIESSELLDSEIDDARPALHRAIAASAPGKLLLRKVHDRYWRTSRGETVFEAAISLGAVYIVRDPRDVAISFATFRGLSLDDAIAFMGNADAVMAARGSGLKSQLQQPLGTWSEHITSWLDSTAMPICLLRYEDMLAAPIDQLTRAARFLGMPADKSAHAIESVRFDRLQEMENVQGFRERPRSAPRFFARGRMGTWKQVLTADQRRRLEGDHELIMTRLGYL
jgi:aryl sulfotransferase